ncbi:MAG TPA: hypothetical protein VKR52_13415 [Terracidiphilus sp.]|nr:hypothetical protein [Terracidiphilus sp.]
MKSALVVAAILVAVSSFPLRSQQPATNPQQTPPSTSQQQTPPPDTQQPAQSGAAQQPSQAAAPEAQPAAPAADLQPVSGKLESKLDSSTAKTGDSIVVKTETEVKMADGTVIPKGSKLVGHVLGVQAQGASSQNSQVAIQFDHAEVKGGQTVPIQTVIKSVGQADTGAAFTSPDAAPSAPAPNAPGAPSGGTQANTPGAPAGAGTPQGSASPGMGQPSPSASAAPAPGTIVARSGNIAIRTTAIPGVLIANNDQGQDPRMARSSGILLGAHRNIELSSGTTVDLAIANSAMH